MRKKIAILCGGPSSEHEVSLNSAKNIFGFLDHDKYEIVICYISKNLHAQLLTSSDQLNEKLNPSIPFLEILEKLKREKYFALLAGIHGEFAEDGKLQVLLEYFDISYSGSISSSSSLCMDKFRSMLVMHSTGIKCPNTSLEEVSSTISIPSNMNFPVIVKPNNLGSSVGVVKVNNNKELIIHSLKLKKDQGVTHVLVQEFIDGIELSCGVLQTKKNKLIRIPPIEIRPKLSRLFDYASKYKAGGSEEITPPVSISNELSEKIIDISTTAHVVLGCKTYSRSDFIVSGKDIFYLETNTLPGMTATSLLPQEAKVAGISFQDLLEFIIENS